MSIKTIDRVWDKSKAAGSYLLLQLALADYCNESDICWPGIKKLHEKARVTRRQVQRLIDGLIENGELYVELGGSGPKDTNRYLVSTGLSTDEIKIRLIEQFQMSESDATLRATSMSSLMSKKWIGIKDADNKEVQDAKGDIQGAKGDIQGTLRAQNHAQNGTEPSLEPSEPSSLLQASPATISLSVFSSSSESKPDYLGDELDSPVQDSKKTKAKVKQASERLSVSDENQDAVESSQKQRKVASLALASSAATSEKANGILYAMQVRLGGQAPATLPEEEARKVLRALVGLAHDNVRFNRNGDALPTVVTDLDSLLNVETPAADVYKWLDRVKVAVKDARPDAGPAQPGFKSAPVPPSKITEFKAELNMLTTVDNAEFIETLEGRRVLHLLNAKSGKCNCGRILDGLTPYQKAQDDLVAACTTIVPCQMCAMLDDRPEPPKANAVAKAEVKQEPAVTAALAPAVVEQTAPVKKGKSAKSTAKAEPRKPQLHVALIEAWMDTVGRDTIPAGVTVAPFTRLGSSLLKAGVVAEDMVCAGQLYRAWLEGLPGKPSLTWDVGEVTNATRQAQGLCKTGIQAADVTKFMAERYADPFWAKKTMSFKHVAENIGAWKGNNKPPVPTADPNCPKCQGQGKLFDLQNNTSWDCDCLKVRS